MMMKDETWDAFHQRLAVLMNEIHGICIANNIRYTMLGGTLIGAVRHRGFIPWDDDIDIGIPYPDYKRFIEVAFSMSHEWIEFDLAGVTDGYYCPFIKAYDKRTTFLESNRDADKPKGIFIDIFPIVKAGNDGKEAIREFRKHRLYQSLLKRKGYHFNTGAIRERVLSFIACFYSVDSLMRKIHRHYDLLDRTDGKLSSDMDGAPRGIVPTELFGSFILYPFEQYMFYGIERADDYLHLVFGDYMRMPPEEERRPHHIEYINLELPYSKFLVKHE